MAVKLHAPRYLTAVSHDGEEYKVIDGIVEVPDRAAATLVAGHGLRFPKSDPKPIVSDDEAIVADTPETLSPREFSANMTQTDMKAFLRRNGVAVPTTGTVGDLRRLVEDTYAVHGSEGHQTDIEDANAVNHLNEKHDAAPKVIQPGEVPTANAEGKPSSSTFSAVPPAGV